MTESRSRARARARTLRRQARREALAAPRLCLVRAPARPVEMRLMPRELVVSTYNVHRWVGLARRSRPDPARAAFVISELGADVIALQEVLRPFHGEDPLARLAEALGLHLVFASTRVHRNGELGNAILSRWPVAGVSILDLSFSRIERRLAVAAIVDGRIDGRGPALNVLATHLALVDRTRQRQVRSLLEHPHLWAGPAVLLGDMNAWRECRATRALERELEMHHNREWPPSFPAARPVLALDRVYSRGVRVLEVATHDSAAARRASDHLPVVARIELPPLEPG
jgi:endonuclease/exonuclease/phosphatase family metal-dependent hydrolase